MAGKKKSFKDENPAMQFINTTGEDMFPETEPDPVTIPPRARTAQEIRTESRRNGVPMKPNPLYVETKSRRLNLLVQPSLHDKIKRLANRKGLSVNELIHRILEEHADSGNV